MLRAPQGVRGAASWYKAGTLVVESWKQRVRISQNCRMVSVWAYVDTPPAGAAIIIDVNRNGVSLWATNPGNRPQIAAGQNSVLVTAFDTVDILEGDIFTVDVDQIGSTTAGSDLSVMAVVLI